MHNGEAAFDEFAQRAAQWLEANVPARWRKNRGALGEAEEVEIRRAWDRLLWEGGFAGLSLPREFGGQGLGLAEEVAFAEAAARAQAPDPLGRIGKILTAPMLIHHGTIEQQSTYLPLILRGEQVWCQGFSEPASGSDLASVTCGARKVDGGYLVKGRKTWTSFSREADRCLLLARTDPEGLRYRNLSVFLVDMRAPGVSLFPIRQISGSQHFSETEFDDVFVAEADRVGAEGEGWTVAMTILKHERGTVEAATRYIEIRADMDLLLSCCTVQRGFEELLVELDIRVELIRAQVQKAIERESDELAFLNSTAGLKVMWSDLWKEITELAMKSPCVDHIDHWRHQYLETRAASIYSGSNEIQRNIIAERVLGLPK